VYVGIADPKPADDPYAIGNCQDAAVARDQFTEKLDDVCIYNRALSAAEIAALAGQ
jgi:hypothetical protein